MLEACTPSLYPYKTVVYYMHGLIVFMLKCVQQKHTTIESQLSANYFSVIGTPNIATDSVEMVGNA